MNKEKEEKIDKLAIQICRDCDSDWCRNRQSYCDDAKKRAERLINAGYGNVKQAVKEFAEKLKENLDDIVMRAVNESWGAAYECINELITELHGADE